MVGVCTKKFVQQADKRKAVKQSFRVTLVQQILSFHTTII